MNKQGTGKRIVAWLIDFLIYFWGGIFLLYTVYGFEYERLVNPSIKNAYKPLLIVFIAWFLIVPAIKNLIFRNTSIGKRIFGLYIVTKETGEKPSVIKLIIRGIVSHFLYPIDALVFICKNGESLGDYITNTEVIKIEK